MRRQPRGPRAGVHRNPLATGPSSEVSGFRTEVLGSGNVRQPPRPPGLPPLEPRTLADPAFTTLPADRSSPTWLRRSKQPKSTPRSWRTRARVSNRNAGELAVLWSALGRVSPAAESDLVSRASAANLRRGEGGEGGEWIVGEDGQPIADWLAGLKVTAPHPFGSLRNTRQRRGRSARPRHRPPPAGDSAACGNSCFRNAKLAEISIAAQRSPRKARDCREAKRVAWTGRASRVHTVSIAGSTTAGGTVTAQSWSALGTNPIPAPPSDCRDVWRERTGQAGWKKL